MRYIVADQCHKARDWAKEHGWKMYDCTNFEERVWEKDGTILTYINKAVNLDSATKGETVYLHSSWKYRSDSNRIFSRIIGRELNVEAI